MIERNIKTRFGWDMMSKKIMMLFLLLFMVGTSFADVNVLIIGSSGHQSAGLMTHTKEFLPDQIGVELKNILDQTGVGSVHVEVIDRMDETPLGYYRPSALFAWFYWDEPAGTGALNQRMSNLKGEAGVQWDYIVLIPDPMVMEVIPGYFSWGVSKIFQTVQSSSLAKKPELVLLATWPHPGEGIPAADVDLYNEVTYRTGRSANIMVAPAGKAWQAAGSPSDYPASLGADEPNADGAYIAASALYSRIWGESASASAYTYNDSLADTANLTVQSNQGQSQYSGPFTYLTPYSMMDAGGKKRAMIYSHRGTSTESAMESRLRDAATNAGMLAWAPNRLKYMDDTPLDDGKGWIDDHGPDDFNYGRNLGSYNNGGGYKTFATNPVHWRASYMYNYGSKNGWTPTTLNRDIVSVEFPSGIRTFSILQHSLLTPNTGHATVTGYNGHATLGGRYIPSRSLARTVQAFDPSALNTLDPEHSSQGYQAIAGAFMFTNSTGRCGFNPSVRVPAGSNDAFWYGYEGAWILGKVTARVPGFQVTPSGVGAAVEKVANRDGGSSDKLKVVFYKKPWSDVQVHVSVSDPDAALLGRETLTFTPDNFYVAQEVHFAVVDRAVSNANVSINFLTTSSDEPFNGLDETWDYVIQNNNSTHTSSVDLGVVQVRTPKNTPVSIVLPTGLAKPENTAIAIATYGRTEWDGHNLVYYPQDDFVGADGVSCAILIDGVETRVSYDILIDDVVSNTTKVEVFSADPIASEDGSDLGKWTFLRTGSTSGDLDVNFVLSGEATLGVDYMLSFLSPVTIPNGQDSVSITLTGIQDSLVNEIRETAEITLASSGSYTPQAGTAAIRIVEDDLSSLSPLLELMSPKGGQARLESGGRMILETRVDDVSQNQGGNIMVQWTQLSGPGVASFEEPTSATTAVSFGVDGTYELQVSGNNGIKQSVIDVVVKVGESMSKGMWSGRIGDVSYIGASEYPNIYDPNPKDYLLKDIQYQTQGQGDLNTANGGLLTNVLTGRIYDADGNISFSVDGAYMTTIYINGDEVAYWSGNGSDPRLEIGNLELVPGWNDFEIRQGVVSTPVPPAFFGPPTPRIGYDPEGGSNWQGFPTDANQVHLLRVDEGNIGSSVFAGSDDVGILADSTVTLSGSYVDDDVVSGPISQTWEKVSGPGEVTLTDDTALSTTSVFDAQGTYVMRLIVDDGQVKTYDDMTVTVLPNLSSPGILEFSKANYIISEGQTQKTIDVKVTRREGSLGPASVSFQTSDGTAKTSDGDYANVHQVIQWAHGESGPKVVSISVWGDTYLEGDETINLKIFAPSGAALGSPSVATITLTDDDQENYVVTYHGNGADSGFLPPHQFKVHNVILTLADNSGGLKKYHKAFLGWNTSPDGSGTSYSEGSVYTLNGDQDLYAKWSSEVLLFEEDFESPSISGYSVGTHSIWGRWLPETTGYNSDQLGLINRDSGSFANPDATNLQALKLDNTNSKLISQESLITKIEENSTYELSFSAVMDGSSANISVNASMVTVPYGVDHREGTSASGSNIMFTINDVAEADGSWKNFSRSFTVDPVEHGHLIGKDLMLVFLTDASSALLDDVRVTAKASLNEVSVVVIDSNASETGPDSSSFSISRSGNTVNPLLVPFSFSGTSNSSDYNVSVSSPVTIPAGQSSVTVVVSPVDDSEVESLESVNLILGVRDVYVNKIDRGQAEIVDNDFGSTMYNLRYIADTGGILSGNLFQEVESGQSATSVTASPDAGYTFDQWADGVSTLSRTDTASANANYIAQFNLKTYAVNYFGNTSNGGNLPINQLKSHGVDLAIHSQGNLTKSSYYFNGWNTDPNGTGDVYEGSDLYSVNADMNLYAQWSASAPSYTITYVAESGGLISGTAVQTVLKGNSSMVVTATPDSNHTFVQWSDGLTTPSRNDVVAGATTYTAYFQKKLYSIVYHGNGMTGGAVPNNQIKTHGVPLTLSEVPVGSLTRTGYNFSTWNIAIDGSGVSYAPGSPYVSEADVTLYAMWFDLAPILLNEDFESPVVSGYSSGSLPDNGNWIASTQGYKANENGLVNKDGGDFSNASLINDQGYAIRYGNAGVTTAEGVLGVVEAGATYTVTFETVMDGSNSTTAYHAQLIAFGPSGDYTDTRSIIDGELLVELIGEAPSDGTFGSNSLSITIDPVANAGNVGRNLALRFRSNSAIIDNVQVVGNIPPKTYNVTYDANGSNAGSVPVDYYNYSLGDAVTVMDDTGNLVKTGFTFTGWKDRSNGSGNSFNPFDIFTLTGDTTLFARWIATGAPNQAPTAMAGNVTTPQGIRTALTLSGSDPNNDPLVYTLVSLPGSGNLSGTAPNLFYEPHPGFGGIDSFTFKVNDGQLDSTSASFSVNVRVPSVFSLSYSAGMGGIISGDSSQSVLEGTSGSTVTAVQSTGYTFSSWSDGVLTPARTDINVQGSQTFTANFSPDTYTITYDANGGTGGPAGPVSKIHGVAITLPLQGSLVKGAETFIGWNTAANGTGPSYAEGASYTAEGDATLYAMWTNLPIHTLSYTAGVGGSITGSTTQPVIQGNDGSAVTAIADTGYTFDQWSDGLTSATRQEQNVNASLSVSASFIADSYIITYYGNGAGGGALPGPTTKSHGTPILLAGLGTLVKANHTFSGWNTAPDGSGTMFPASSSYALEGDASLYAIWMQSTTLLIENFESPVVSSWVKKTIPAGGNWIATTNAGGFGWDTHGLINKDGSEFVHPDAANQQGYTFRNKNSGLTTSVNALGPVTIGQTVSVSLEVVNDLSNGGDAYSIQLLAVPHASARTTIQSLPTGATLLGSAVTGNAPSDGSVGSVSFSVEIDATYSADVGKDLTLRLLGSADAAIYDNVKIDLLSPSTGYSVSYNANSASGGSVPVDGNSYNNGDTAVVLGNTGNLVRSGYVFAGWNTAVNGSGTTYTASDSFTVASSTTLYAEWSPLATFTLSYSAGVGGTLTGDASQSVLPGDSGTTVTAVPDTGYTFDQWDDGSSSSSRQETNVSANLSFVASFAATSYSVTVTNGNGSGSYPFGDVVNISATVPVGYTFLNWTGDTAGVADVNNPTTTVAIPVSSVNLTANFTINQYTITFDSNGGSAVSDIVLDYGATVIAPANPSRSGFAFTSWSPALPATMPANDVVVTAQWTTQPTYALAITSGTGSGNYPSGDVVAISATIPTGYSFVNWTGDTAGVNDVNSATTTVTMPASAVNLTANFTIAQYTMSFDSNGGTSVSDITLNYGATITAPANPTRSGYIFSAWSPALPATMPASNTTVTAQWAPIPTYALAVTDGTGSGNYPSGNVVAIVATVPTGYSFSNWSGDISGVDDVNSASTTVTMPASAVNITANFTVDQYTISFDSNGGSSVADLVLDYGATVTAPVAPNQSGYAFISWSPALPTTMPVNGLSVTAQWNAQPVVDAGVDQAVSLSGGSSWTPALLSTASAAWYDASDVNTINSAGGSVSRWEDKSGNGVHLDQLNAANQPSTGVDAFNGKNVLTFNGATGPANHDLVAIASVSSSQLFAVVQYTGLKSNRPTILGDVSQNAHYLQLVDNDTDGVPEGFNGVSPKYNGFSTTGVASDLVNPTLVRINKTIASCNLGIGKDRGYSNRGFDGYVAEIVMFGSVLSQAEQEMVEGYLAHKWGLEANLPGTHTYKLAPPGGSPTAVVNLDATVTDPESDPTSLSWSVTSGTPSNVSFDDTTTEDPVVTISGNGTYILTLSADDTYNTAVTDTVTINVGSAPSVPVVSVSASDPAAAEAGQDTGTWTISRTGATTASLDVDITLTGSATEVDDYSSVTKPVTIPVGQSSVIVTLTPVDDSDVEGSETATLSIDANANYSIGTASADITIADDDVTSYVLTVTDGTGSGSYLAGDVVNISASIPTGYSFSSWSGYVSGVDDVNSAVTTITMPSAAVNLTANFTINQYTISYDGNGNSAGSAPAPQTKTHAVDLTLATAGTLVKSGSTFSGWNTAADGSGMGYAAGATYSAEADTTLYAQWTALPTYTLTYTAGVGGSITGSSTQTVIQGGSGSAVTATASTGYTFVLWSDGDTNASRTATNVTADVTVSASFVANTYTISYDGNGNSAGSAPANQTKTHAVNLTLATAGTLVNSGSTFAGWNTAADGSGTAFAVGSIYSLDADVTLYAQWSIGVVNAPSFVEGKAVTVTMSEDGVPMAFSLSLHVNDDDMGETFAWALDKSVVQGNLSFLASGNQVDFDYTPVANWNGVELFTLSVEDSQGLSDNVTVSLVVEPVNDNPTLNTPSLMFTEDVPSPFILSVDNVDGEVTSVSWKSISSLGVISGEYPSYTFAPFSNANGNESLVLTLSDSGGSVDVELPLTVAPVNDVPTGTGSSFFTNYLTKVYFDANDFGFSDADGDSLVSAKFLSEPVKHRLYLGTRRIRVGAVLTLSELNSGELSFNAGYGHRIEEVKVSLSDGSDESSPVSLFFSVIDKSGPTVISVENDGVPMVSNGTITFSFDEEVKTGSGVGSVQELANYTVVTEDGSTVQVSSVVGESSGPYTVSFDRPLPDGSLSLRLSGIQDLLGNEMRAFTTEQNVIGLQLAQLPDLWVGSQQSLVAQPGVSISQVLSSDPSTVLPEGTLLKGLRVGTSTITLSEANGSQLSLDVEVKEANVVSVAMTMPDYGTEQVFKLVCFPVDLYTFGELRVLLETQLGPMGPTNWMVYEYTANSAQAYVVPEDTTPTDPTRAYWMATVGARNLQLEGFGPPTGAKVVRTLSSGWNLIGNPYTQSVSLDHFFVMEGGVATPMTSEDQSSLAPVAWKLNATFDGYDQVTSLGAGEGAWIYNDSSEAITLTIDSSTSLGKAVLSKSVLADLQPPVPPKEKVSHEPVDQIESSESGLSIPVSAGGGGGGGCLLR